MLELMEQAQGAVVQLQNAAIKRPAHTLPAEE